MPAYNFKKQFVEPIRLGKKHTTIRPYRNGKPTQAGDVLTLYTGQRTKQCEKIGVYRCVSIVGVTIWPMTHDMRTDEKPLNQDEIRELAKTDGFENVDDFFQFFNDVYGPGPLHMQLITWTPIT